VVGILVVGREFVVAIEVEQTQLEGCSHRNPVVGEPRWFALEVERAQTARSVVELAIGVVQELVAGLTPEA